MMFYDALLPTHNPPDATIFNGYNTTPLDTRTGLPAVLTDRAIAVVEQRRAHEQGQYVPFAGYVSFTAQLRAMAAELLVPPQDLSLETVGVLEHLLFDTRHTLAYLASPAVPVLTVREMGAVDELKAAYGRARSQADAMLHSVPMRQSFEEMLFALLAPPQLPGVIFSADTAAVLCLYYSGTAHRLSPVLDRTRGLWFYLRSCGLCYDHDNEVTIVRVPRWLHTALTVSVSALEYLNESHLHKEGPVTDAYTAAHTVFSPHCVDVPSADVLESALALWSGTKDDLYYNLDAAIATASHLT